MSIKDDLWHLTQTSPQDWMSYQQAIRDAAKELPALASALAPVAVTLEFCQAVFCPTGERLIAGSGDDWNGDFADVLRLDALLGLALKIAAGEAGWGKMRWKAPELFMCLKLITLLWRAAGYSCITQSVVDADLSPHRVSLMVDQCGTD